MRDKEIQNENAKRIKDDKTRLREREFENKRKRKLHERA